MQQNKTSAQSEKWREMECRAIGICTKNKIVKRNSSITHTHTHTPVCIRFIWTITLSDYGRVCRQFDNVHTPVLSNGYVRDACLSTERSMDSDNALFKWYDIANERRVQTPVIEIFICTKKNFGKIEWSLCY